jgi:hypothetical protein
VHLSILLTQCRQIGQNAMAFYEKYVARDALLDYVEMVCKQISKRYKSPPPWYETPTPARPPPQLQKPDTKCFEGYVEDKNDKNKKIRVAKYCLRCQIEVDAEKRKKEEEEEQEKATRSRKRSDKTSLRERMKKRAKNQPEAKKI